MLKFYTNDITAKAHEHSGNIHIKCICSNIKKATKIKAKISTKIKCLREPMVAWKNSHNDIIDTVI